MNIFIIIDDLNFSASGIQLPNQLVNAFLFRFSSLLATADRTIEVNLDALLVLPLLKRGYYIWSWTSTLTFVHRLEQNLQFRNFLFILLQKSIFRVFIDLWFVLDCLGTSSVTQR